MQSLGLIMHELATNATKHGALSTSGRAGGDRLGARAGRGVELIWQESGGPPVGPPERKGFGRVVFERIGASLDGEIATDFRPEGFVCAVTIAANNLLLPNRRAPNAPTAAARPRALKSVLSSAISIVIGDVSPRAAELTR